MTSFPDLGTVAFAAGAVGFRGPGQRKGPNMSIDQVSGTRRYSSRAGVDAKVASAREKVARPLRRDHPWRASGVARGGRGGGGSCSFALRSISAHTEPVAPVDRCGSCVCVESARRQGERAALCAATLSPLLRHGCRFRQVVSRRYVEGQNNGSVMRYGKTRT